MENQIQAKPTIPSSRPVSPDYKPPGLKRPQTVAGDVPISPEPEEKGKLEIMFVETFEKESGYPYAADYYQLDTPYEFVDVAMKEDIEEIDKFVKSRLGDESMEMTLGSYSKILKGIEDEMGIDDSMFRNASILKVANLARNFNLVFESFSKVAMKKILEKLLKMEGAGSSTFDQKEFILEKLGGMI